jgi:hypothetical protein
MADALKRRLLEVILMLLGLQVFTLVVDVLFGLYAFGVNSDLRDFVFHYQAWIGRVIFGILILLLTGKYNKKVALPIALLAGMSPAVGCMFYLIASTISIDKLNKWFIDLLDS